MSDQKKTAKLLVICGVWMIQIHDIVLTITDNH